VKSPRFVNYRDPFPRLACRCGLRPVCASERSRWRGGRCRVGDAGSPDFGQVICGSQGGVPVTHLRKMMLEELQRRHYSEATTQRYIRLIERFAQHFHCSPDRLGPRHIREYQAQLFTVHKLTPGSVTNHISAPCAFSTSRRSRGPGALPTLPIPRSAIACPLFSVRKKSRSSSMLRRLPSIAPF
jgi:hypothetical protein